eukprot:2552846-Ditylum_brightwellii.AAC.1
MYTTNGKENHSTKKEDAGTTKERSLPHTIVLHSSNEKLPKYPRDVKQYPVAYYIMLKNACKTARIATLAVETGLTSDTMLSKSMQTNFPITKAE